MMVQQTQHTHSENFDSNEWYFSKIVAMIEWSHCFEHYESIELTVEWSVKPNDFPLW